MKTTVPTLPLEGWEDSGRTEEEVRQADHRGSNSDGSFRTFEPASAPTPATTEESETGLFDGPSAQAFRYVHEERQRQERLKALGKFAYTCADVEMSHFERYTVLGEEVGEVGHELNESVGGRNLDRIKLRKELIEVAAVAIAWIEAIDKESAK